MQRLTTLNPETTTGKSKELFDAIQGKLGMVPNMMRTMGNSPAVLNGYLQLNTALGASKIGAKLGELLALTIANANGCEYCNAAHSFIGEKLVHIDGDEINDARQGHSSDPKTQAALTFARQLVENKGRVTSADIEAVKAAGYDEGNVAEIIAHVGLNLLTNYFNNAVRVEVDFPQVELVETAAI